MKEDCAKKDLAVQFGHSFQSLLDSVSSTNATRKVALAFSGGLDSTVLLSLLKTYQQKFPLEIYAFYVNHGISKNSDQWQSHCQLTAAQANVAFDSRKLELNLEQYGSVEAIARDARYRALGEMCHQHNVALLLTAHHSDDQVETSLMNLFGGAGIFGMAGMESVKFDFGLLRNASVTLLRPLINFSRKELANYLNQVQWVYIEDESNQDLKYRRNLLRNKLIPQIEQELPGAMNRITRSIAHMQSGRRLLMQLAEADFEMVKGQYGLVVSRMRTLSIDRLDNLLRFWLDRQHLPMPSLAQLTELKKQVLTWRNDAQVEFHFQRVSVYLDRDELVLAPRIADQAAFDSLKQGFVWCGEATLDFPDFFGRIRFTEAKFGLAANLLKAGQLFLHFRQGGERISVGQNRPGRELKKQYQAFDVPYWQRRRLPLLSSDHGLLFAAGLGINAKFASEAENVYQLIWESDLLYCK